MEGGERLGTGTAASGEYDVVIEAAPLPTNQSYGCTRAASFLRAIVAAARYTGADVDLSAEYIHQLCYKIALCRSSVSTRNENLHSLPVKFGS